MDKTRRGIDEQANFLERSKKKTARADDGIDNLNSLAGPTS